MNNSLKKIIFFHKKIHPSLTVQDVYKILFQGTMGPLHIMHNREKAFSELKKEFIRIGQDNIEDENLLEQVSIDGKVVRVNLRPYKKEINDIELLFKAMVESAKNFIPDREKLTNLWQKFKGLVQKGELDFDYNEIELFEKNENLKKDTYIKHSEIYRKTEKPSYRIVLKESLLVFCD